MAAKDNPIGIESPIEGNSVSASWQPASSQTRVPSAAKWLGALGAIPFVFLAVAGPFLEGTLQEQVSFALAAYGAVILSFLGGIHWGLAIAGFGPEQSDSTKFRRLAFSVIPSLIGWGALFLPRPHGLLFLAAAFSWMLLFDLQASRKEQVPPWYRKLRCPLTAVVVTSLTVEALA